MDSVNRELQAWRLACERRSQGAIGSHGEIQAHDEYQEEYSDGGLAMCAEKVRAEIDVLTHRRLREAGFSGISPNLHLRFRRWVMWVVTAGTEKLRFRAEYPTD